MIDEPIQNKIAALVRQSFALKNESGQLLDVAKRAVEIAIEQDEAAALDFVTKQTGLLSSAGDNKRLKAK